MCGLLGVPRSSFYAWRNRTESPTAARRRALAEHIKRVFADSRHTSGCRRVAAALNREGHECSVGLVADLMRELGLKAVQPRAYKRTTIPGEEPVDTPDLLGRDFAAGGTPGTRLVGDITYLKTGEGWLYLATVIDLVRDGSQSERVPATGQLNHRRAADRRACWRARIASACPAVLTGRRGSRRPTRARSRGPMVSGGGRRLPARSEAEAGQAALPSPRSRSPSLAQCGTRSTAVVLAPVH